MPQITLNKTQIDKLSTFAKKHDLKKWFMAKDEGAYVGASAGEAGNCIFYFKGMNPNVDAEEAYENARYAFGGDDFGQHFEIADIHRLSADPRTSKLVVKVTEASITIDVYTKKPQPTPKAAAKAVAPKPTTKKVSKGAQIQFMLKNGCDIDLIVETVGTTKNSVRWYMSKMKKAA